MIKVKSVPMLIVGFVILIVGITILLNGIFNMIPSELSEENMLIWVVIILIGVVLTLTSVIAIHFAQE